MDDHSIQKSTFPVVFKKYCLLILAFLIADLLIHSLVPLVINSLLNMKGGFIFKIAENFTWVILNSILMVLVIMDLKKFNLNYWIIPAIVFFYREIGVCLLLLSFMYEENKRRL